MRHLKLKNAALAALLAGAPVVVGVLVWPTPKEAVAAQWSVYVEMDWDPWGDPRDVNVTAQLYSATMAPIGGPKDLNDLAFSFWTGTLEDSGITPYYIVFRWDYDPQGEDEDRGWWNIDANGWADPSGEAVPANTILTTLSLGYIPL